MTPYITDRTTIETDWECGEKFYLYRLEGGGGIVPAVEAEWFTVGRDFHKDLSLFPAGRQMDEILSTLPFDEVRERGNQVELEQLYRRAGWVVAFAKEIWPILSSQYDVVSYEKEYVLDRGDLWIPTTPDLVGRRKTNGRLVYFEYKTARSLSASFTRYWTYAIQLHLGIKAVEEELGEKVECAQVIGLNKGQERWGRLNHPYVWAYRDPASPTSWTHEYRKGWDHAGVWDYPGTVEEWVAKCGPLVAADQFTFTPPIACDDRLVEETVIRRRYREEEVARVREAARLDPKVRAQYFEKRFTKCAPVVGAPCPYLAACHNAFVNKDPLGSGQFKPREPHHEIELIQVD